MQVVNKTKCPTGLLEELLVHAAKCGGADLDGVVVVIKPSCSRKYIMRGVAYNTAPPTVTLYISRHVNKPDDVGKMLWELAIHELVHVADYQSHARGVKLDFTRYANTNSMRAIKHDDRPCELRANAVVFLSARLLDSGEIPKCPAIAKITEWAKSNNF